jgi:4a-hydroxytetrahydrobiopterin dehydratase
MRTHKLSEDEIAARLARLPGWARQGDAIARTFRLADFRRALDFVVAVGEAAEAADHHPDVDIRYNKVTLMLTTHDSGGLTVRDMDLAAECDRLAGDAGR